MINPLTLIGSYRDFPADYNARAEINARTIAASGCFVPRYYHAPDNAGESVAAYDRKQFNLLIPAGSFIYGYWHSGSLGCQVQVTDVGLQNQWFSNPIPDKFLRKGAAGIEDYPNLLCNPYPVVSPGIFIVEFWNPTAVAKVCQLTFGVAEVRMPPC